MARMPLRYVHGSQLGLNRVHRDVPPVDDDVRRCLEDAPLIALERFVEAAVEHEVDFALVTGPTIVEPLLDPRSLATLRDAIECLDDAGIRLIVVPAGAHDASFWKRALHRRPNTAILDAIGAESVVQRDGESVAVVSCRRLREDGHIDLHASAVTGAHRIVVVEAVDAGRIDTAGTPVDEVVVEAGGIREVFRENDVAIRIGGRLHATTADDTGPHGCELVDVDRHGRFAVTTLPTDPVRRESVELDADFEGDLDAIAETAVGELLARGPQSGEDVWIVQWRIAAGDVLDKSLRPRLNERIDARWRDHGGGRLVHMWEALELVWESSADDSLERELERAVEEVAETVSPALTRLLAEHDRAGDDERLARRLRDDIATGTVLRRARRLLQYELRRTVKGGNGTMRIEDIRIERFGVWNELSLALPHANVNALYGANEAGKSTLLRFVRGVLYGGGPRIGPLDGTLSAVHHGRRYDVSRRLDGDIDRLDVTGGESGVTPQATLDSLLQGVDRDVYERIFAIGLGELQELGTLDDDAVGELLYGTTLGADGRRVAGLRDALAARRRHWLGESGRLESLMQRHAAVANEFGDASRIAVRHAELQSSVDDGERDIERLRTQREHTVRELRGLRLVELAREPWAEVERLRADLAKLPETTIPERVFTRLERLDESIETRGARRREVRHTIGELRADARRLRDRDDVQRFEPLVRTLVDRRRWFDRTSEQATELRGTLDRDQAAADEALRELGDGWSRERLETFDGSRVVRDRLGSAAKSFEKAVMRRRRLQRLRRRLSKRVQSQAVRLQEWAKTLDGVPVREAITSARARLVALRELGQLRTTTADLEHRRDALSARRDWLLQRARLPDWMYGVLAFFGVAGAVFMILGLVTGVTSSIVAGAVYALLGVTCGSLAWTLGSHFTPKSEEELDRLAEERGNIEADLRRARERMAVLSNDEHDPTIDESDATVELLHEIADLERLAAAMDRSVRLRKRQTELRARHQSVQTEYASARQHWCEAVRSAGLTETLKTAAALEEWESVTSAQAASRAIAARRREVESLERSLREFTAQVDAVAAALGETVDHQSGEPWFADWTARAERANESAEMREITARLRDARRSERRLTLRIAWAKRLRRALLQRHGVDSAERLRDRLYEQQQRAELLELLEVAEADLEAVTEGEVELAITEDQLRKYDAEDHRTAIELAELEQAELDEKLQSAHEQLGRLREEAAALERDRTAIRLRFDAERAYEGIREATEELLAVEAAEQAVQRAVEHLERDWQPPALEDASRFLARLTGGRHRRIWTPLGRRELRVDGEAGDGLGVTQLSRGTREQLFLALRLAMISRMASDGVELPLVLDDVCVNFDRDRTDAAIRTLVDFAGDTRQVLFFTCHLHVAELFQQHGIEPIWLPSHDRREERRAG